MFKIFESPLIWVILFALVYQPISNHVLSEVVRIEISERTIFADSMNFSSVGFYEKIRGRLYYAVDPDNPANSQIIDLTLAPKNPKGLVEFVGDFFILKPFDLSKGNHRILYDVNNRGNFYMLGSYNNARGSNNPTTKEHAGNGFLMRQGYTLLWSAWNWDVREGNNRLQIELPNAMENGKSITQKIVAEIVVNVSNTPIKSQPLAWGGSRCYPVVDMDNTKSKLTVRDKPRGKRQEVPHEKWQFARNTLDGEIAPDPTYLYLEDGFESGKIYELIYQVKDPKVVGLGLAAIRDALSFFHFETTDKRGNPNPLLISSKPDPEKVYIFGISQSGRVITHMIYEGFHVDEKNRMVFDGARIHVAGGGKGGFNHRFSQTTHHPSHLEGNYMPADFFPFNYALQKDPITGKTGDVLEVAKKLGKIPLIMITNNTLEYWTRSASLIHTDVTGTKDAEVHENVRIYMTNGAPHGNGSSRRKGMYEHPGSTLNHSPVIRSLLVALDQWVIDGTEPPKSQYPRIDKNQLFLASEHKKKFPKIPNLRHPGKNLQPPRVNYGPDFWSKGIFTVVPPEMKEPNITLVPNFDKDGNGLGGIRLPELQIPLATYQGWNPRRTEFGAPNYLGRFAGATWPFPNTKEERLKTGDPRLSIKERYSDQQEYVEKITNAVKELIAQRLILKEDGDIYIQNAKNMVWPPEPIERRPFWKMKSN